MQGNGNAALGLVGLALVVLLPGLAAGNPLEESLQLLALARETTRLLGRHPDGHAPLGTGERTIESPGGDIRGHWRPVAEAQAAARSQRIRRMPKKHWPVSAIDRLIRVKATAHGINPNFVRAVVAAESGYHINAYSRKGAVGLMQLMPATAERLAVHDPWDPAANVEGGVRFLGQLLWEFRDPGAALVAYHAGPGVVRQGWPVPGETQVYVRSVLTHFQRMQGAAGGR